MDETLQKLHDCKKAFECLRDNFQKKYADKNNEKSSVQLNSTRSNCHSNGDAILNNDNKHDNNHDNTNDVTVFEEVDAYSQLHIAQAMESTRLGAVFAKVLDRQDVHVCDLQQRLKRTLEESRWIREELAKTQKLLADQQQQNEELSAKLGAQQYEMEGLRAELGQLQEDQKNHSRTFYYRDSSAATNSNSSNIPAPQSHSHQLAEGGDQSAARRKSHHNNNHNNQLLSLSASNSMIGGGGGGEGGAASSSSAGGVGGVVGGGGSTNMDLEMKVPPHLRTVHSLVLRYMKQGRYEVALPLARQALSELSKKSELEQQRMTQHHQQSAGGGDDATPGVSGGGKAQLDEALMLTTVSQVYREMKEYDKAVTLLEGALEIRERVLGAHHPCLASVLNNIAVIYSKCARFGEAEGFARRALAIRVATLPEMHPVVIKSANNMALIYMNLDDDVSMQHVLERLFRLPEIASSSAVKEAATTATTATTTTATTTTKTATTNEIEATTNSTTMSMIASSTTTTTTNEGGGAASGGGEDPHPHLLRGLSNLIRCYLRQEKFALCLALLHRFLSDCVTQQHAQQVAGKHYDWLMVPANEEEQHAGQSHKAVSPSSYSSQSQSQSNSQSQPIWMFAQARQRAEDARQSKSVTSSSSHAAAAHAAGGGGGRGEAHSIPPIEPEESHKVEQILQLVASFYKKPVDKQLILTFLKLLVSVYRRCKMPVAANTITAWLTEIERQPTAAANSGSGGTSNSARSSKPGSENGDPPQQKPQIN